MLGERSSVRPEVADVSERHPERTCFKLSARPTTVMGIIHKTDANTDINTDWADSSDQTQKGQPREGMTKSRQKDLSEADISMDQLRSEGLRRWNTDMDIEYQYETFNGLPVYYGGGMIRRSLFLMLRMKWNT